MLHKLRTTFPRSGLCPYALGLTSVVAQALLVSGLTSTLVPWPPGPPSKTWGDPVLTRRMTAMWVTLITHSRIVLNQQYLPCSLYQTCLVRDTAYPNLTLQYKSLLNPYSLYGNTYNHRKISHLEKYLQQGFQFIPCQESHTSRFQCRSNAWAVTDSGSLWINLRTGLQMDQHPADIFHQYGVLDVEWRLGGHICRSDCFLQPHIRVIKDKSWVSFSFPPPFEIVLSYPSVRSYLYSHWSVR